jgi:lipopolysaccharide/colanic/teichoic acid biosynthesis glycosyltransferase
MKNDSNTEHKESYISLNTPATQNDVLNISAFAHLRPLRLKGTPYYLQPESQRSFYSYAKRTLDVLGALLIILAALPLIAAIAILIKLTSKGPVIFLHKRLGKN